MNQDFQDIIDKYLLHGDTMSEEDKAQFLKDIEEDAEKREQYELTKTIKEALVSRGEKLEAMAEFQRQLDALGAQRRAACNAPADTSETSGTKPSGRGRTWLWLSGIAAILVVGFFAISPLFDSGSTDGNVRGGDDVLNPTVPNDSTANDTTTIDTTALLHK